MRRTQTLIAFSIALIAFLIVSGIRPYDRVTWALEVLPVVIVLPILAFTYRRFPLTTLLYGCILIHSVVLIVGGIYTYSRVPLGHELADFFGLERNPYDKIGHFCQGFVPALAAREILARGNFVRGGKTLVVFVVCIALAGSALYELVEWGAALTLGQGADEFLGTQGDSWDTQSDIFLALVGAATMLLLFSRMHDRQMRALESAVDHA